MTILHLLRNVTRVHLESHFAQQLCQARALTGAEAVNALRPFYFAVHPDFFGQYPEEREVNENSLKRLNGYLESLQKPGRRSLKPLPLTFYVRDAADRGFRTVNFTLETTDIQSTVLVVLKSCSLSTDHIHPGDTQQQNKLATSVPFYRPIRWDKTYYAFTGYKDPEEELELAKKVEPKLGLWLIRNEARATKKQKESLSLRSELKRLKKDLCHHLGLSDIRWQRSWALAHKCSQLHSLSRLSQQNPEAVKGLQGHTVIFTDQSGINAAGHVMLGTTDVHHQWAKMLEKLPNYSKLLVEASNLEERISHLLGGMQVIYIEKLQPLLMLEEYYSMLSAFYKRLLTKRIPFHPRSLEGLQMTLENDCSRPRLDDLGHFNIPIIFDPSTLHWFVQTNAQEARQRIKRKEELEAEENALVLICAERLSLKRLYKESSISNSQMIPCCQRLIEEGFPLLQGMYLCVSHFYSVLQDGDMCIPWDWKK
ncbi:T-cell activation inhibitor, mitochondrial isoform X1 [Polypterus senegalus]|uniref:T-cell activation inhibitor, mitochondrial isoform X1 n=1 Tax=Polypterus senegalus TaxID=55291 RepID=UPI0019630A1F|nr:T-cell activation inhibitor, mitochondrial isoform X1 [Polypterus senegalus]